MNEPSLNLQPTEHLPRELTLRLSPGFGLSAWLYLGRQMAFSACYASADIHDCRLEQDKKRCILWLARSCYELTQSEARQVISVFAPLGLRIVVISEFPSPDAPLPSPASAYEAAIAALSPPQNGERGAGVPSGTTDDGTTLELSNCMLVKALTAHESY